MRMSRFTDSQIMAILKEADSGLTVQEICRQHGISPATFHKWKSKYGGLEASDLKRPRELKTENSWLERMYADLSLVNNALKQLMREGSKAAGAPRSGGFPGRGSEAHG